MNISERWQLVEDLFHVALKMGPAERETFLAKACRDDPDMLAEVRSLIAAQEKEGSFLDSPAQAALESLSDLPVESLIGRLVGRYEIITQLGKGGMGVVYLARDARLDRKVAVKLLPAEFSNRERLSRFVQEAKAASSLNHPNIITIHEIGEQDGSHYIVTEFIDGKTLRERLRKNRLETGEALDIAVQVASALEAAHAAGIVHRDIKPENLMVRSDGLVKVLDFGLAKAPQQRSPDAGSEAATEMRVDTVPGMVIGTVRYMSPEQARGMAVDARSDIFSLGAVLYEMLTGRAAFDTSTKADTLASILKSEPPPIIENAPDTPVEMQRIVNKCLRKDKEERYQTIKDVMVDLKVLKQELLLGEKPARHPAPLESGGRASRSSGGGVLPSGPITMPGGSPKTANGVVATPQTSLARKRRVIVAGLVIAGLLGAGVLAVIVWPSFKAQPTLPVETAPAEGSLTYRMAMQKYLGGETYDEPSDVLDEITFQQGDGVRLYIRSPRSGYLYVLNEGPPKDGRIPALIILFPSVTATAGGALIEAGREVQVPATEKGWLQFDEEEGTEKIWLVWAAKPVADLEAVTKFANPDDRGVIRSPTLDSAAKGFLRSFSVPLYSETDDQRKETHLWASRDILVHSVKLDHR